MYICTRRIYTLYSVSKIFVYIEYVDIQYTIHDSTMYKHI